MTFPSSGVPPGEAMLLTRLAERVSVMLAYWNRDERCLFANRAYELWFGVAPEALLGKTLAELLGPIYAQNRPYIEGALNGIEQSFEREIPDPQGGPPRWSLAQYVPDTVDGEVRGFFVVVSNITEQKRVEHAFRRLGEERISAMTSLAAGIAHEINNPLAVVLANLETLLEGEERAVFESATLDRLEDARVGALRVATIVESMKLLSYGNASSSETTDVNRTIRESLRVMANLSRYSADVTLDLQDVGRVAGETSRIAHVLVGLFVNAAQSFGEDNERPKRIRVAAALQGDRVVIEVADTGSGILPEHRPRVFEPFFTTRDVGAGPGLGLSTAHAIVTSLRGEITFESVCGVGTTFRVSLPRAADASASAEVPSAAPLPRRTGAERPRLLVVDDESSLTVALKRIFGREFDVDAVNDGRHAVALLREAGARYDVILCDVSMPDVDGPKVYVEATTNTPNLKDRFVFMTGGAFTASAREFLAAVDAPVVAKPFDLPALRAVIRARASSRNPTQT